MFNPLILAKCFSLFVTKRKPFTIAVAAIIRSKWSSLFPVVSNSDRISAYFFIVSRAVIGNFNFLNSRDDVGQLWENYIVMERIKKRAYHQIYGNQFFWRTWDQKDIDIVEERDGKVHGYDFKRGNKKPDTPNDWLETYENATYEVVNRENFLEFVG